MRVRAATEDRPNSTVRWSAALGAEAVVGLASPAFAFHGTGTEECAPGMYQTGAVATKRLLGVAALAAAPWFIIGLVVWAISKVVV